MLLADLSEPNELIQLVKQSVPVTILNLNQTQRSDYYFGGEDGKTRQFSRKQAGELLGNLGEAESQVREYYENADENYQIIEGIISPVPITNRSRTLDELTVRTRPNPNALFTYKVADNGYIHGEQVWNVSAVMLFSWITSLEKAGVLTHYTINWIDTAHYLVANYMNNLKPPEEHTVLNRYIRPRIQIKSQSPFVKALMFLSAAYKLDIGEKKATALAAKYKTIYDLNMAEVSELCICEGIGKGTARKLLEALGREL